jgi:hypothetical protein
MLSHRGRGPQLAQAATRLRVLGEWEWGVQCHQESNTISVERSARLKSETKKNVKRVTTWTHTFNLSQIRPSNLSDVIASSSPGFTGFAQKYKNGSHSKSGLGMASSALLPAPLVEAGSGESSAPRVLPLPRGLASRSAKQRHREQGVVAPLKAFPPCSRLLASRSAMQRLATESGELPMLPGSTAFGAVEQYFRAAREVASVR